MDKKQYLVILKQSFSNGQEYTHEVVIECEWPYELTYEISKAKSSLERETEIDWNYSPPTILSCNVTVTQILPL